MRVAASGSRSTGKSTLIAALVAKRPRYVYEPEAYEVLADDIPLTPAGDPGGPLAGDRPAGPDASQERDREMNLRVARETDIPHMHEVRVSVRENRLSDPSRIQFDDYRAMLTRRGRGWVAEIDGRVAGFAVADREASNVWALFVHPDFEGRGVGRRLHDAMMEWFFGTGAEGAWLSTSPGTRAETFYTKAGWRLAGREANGELRFEMSRDAWLARSAGT